MNVLVINTFVAVLLIVGFLVGIRWMQSPRTALRGNRLGILCMGIAVLFTMYRTDLLTDVMAWLLIIFGGILGFVLGERIRMIRMPQMVALLNGFGGAASAIVAGVAIMLYTEEISLLARLTAAFALAVGPLTFSGSIVAALKLQDWMVQQPVFLRGHHVILRLLLASGLILILMSIFGTAFPLVFTGIVLLFAAYGVLMTLRVGGADMPIIIALLNSFSGIAASITGLAVNNALLTGVGALVGVAGLVLTRLMCRAMNRSLSSVLGGFAQAVSNNEKRISTSFPPNLKERLSGIMEAAEKVIIVPGYGMALAQAQQAVKDLVTVLEHQGKQVKIALNPMAGRMTGHMNVLLAEVGIDYEMLFYVDEINPEFPETDLVVVIGACDVINPAADTEQNSPFYGMSILKVNQAKNIILCNRYDKPGYSGVKNSLYDQKNLIPLWGDASETVPELTALLQHQTNEQDGESVRGDPKTIAAVDNEQISGVLEVSEKVIIVPGYGMAVAQAQLAVKDLVMALQNQGKIVKIAVHPVAGRMPGHMYVLLAEVGIDYQMLFDMDDINPEFSETDLVVVVGACDVINPAAVTAQNTPIYGMPVLKVDQAKNVILCNFDSKPGYSGVENTLYNRDQVIAMWGDAAETVPKLTMMLQKQKISSV